MKTKTFVMLLAGGMLCCVSPGFAIPASITANSTDNNLAIPDNDLNGVASTLSLSTSIQSITSLTLTLDISGGNNGDYYAFLTDGSAHSILLNRVGVNGSNPDGYSDSG